VTPGDRAGATSGHGPREAPEPDAAGSSPPLTRQARPRLNTSGAGSELSRPTGPLALLIARVHGSWAFAPAGTGVRITFFLLGGHPFPAGTLAFGAFFVAALLVERNTSRQPLPSPAPDAVRMP
jgi:hypothetical protein